MTDHPDLEALSAAVDGEDGAGTVASHARTCAVCRERLEGMRSARRIVAAPVPPLDAGAREAMIAAALAAASPATAGPAPAPAAASAAAPAPAPVVPLPARPGPRRRWWAAGGAAAAAVMALVVGAAGMLGRGADDSTDTALGGGAVAESESPTAAAPPAAAGDRVVDAGSLGDVPSVESLRARFAVPMASPAGQGSSVAARSASDSLASAAPTSAPVAREIGTRPCEEQARTARPQVGGLVYVATGRFAGTPAVFLGFAASAEGPPATVLVLAESGCRLLAETSVP